MQIAIPRNGVVIMPSQPVKVGLMRPNNVAAPERGAWGAYIWVHNADDLHAEFESRGVEIVRGLCDQPYNCREFDIKDCNGYILCFGQDLEP